MISEQAKSSASQNLERLMCDDECTSDGCDVFVKSPLVSLYGALKSVLPTANKIGYGRRWKYVSVYMPAAHV